MEIVSPAVLLFLIMDPFGNIPLFLSALRHVPNHRWRRVLTRELLIALAVLVLFLFAGKTLLEVMQISESSLRIAGGILLFLIALRMVFPRSGQGGEEEPAGEPFIVPLAVPLVAGPSAIATVILIGNGDGAKWPMWLLAVFIAWAAAASILLLAGPISKLLGHRGLIAAERLMGMLTVAISVEMTLGGLREFMNHTAAS